MRSLSYHSSLLALQTLLATLCAAKKSPNLIIILTDDHGYQDVGFNGCTDIPTPNLDSIAQNGIRFTEGYVSYPVCGPSRAGLLTGRYQDRFGFTNNPTLDPKNPIAGIPLEEENMAEVLRKVGYESAVIGKWHLGSHPVHHPLNRGFDHFFGFLPGGHSYFSEEFTLNDLSEVEREGDWYRTRLLNNFETVDTGGYLTDELSKAANAVIDSHVQSNSTPFLLYLAYNAPHSPLQATKKYLKRFRYIANKKRRTYAAMLSAVDDGVGLILETLRRHGLEEDTIVVFLSDNGGASNNSSDNGPLRGHKSDLFEGGLHVPFAMQWKGTLPAGQDYTHPVISLDIMATITELAGASIAPERPLDGVNLIPYLTGEVEGPPHRQLFWRKLKKNAMAIREGHMKLVSNTNQKNNNYKLFNLRVDPGERWNRIDRNTTQALKQSWDEWNGQLIDCIFPAHRQDRWWEVPADSIFGRSRIKAP